MTAQRVVPLVVGVAVALLTLVGRPIGGLAGLLLPIAMGAIFREQAFAAGALVTVPGIALALTRALSSSSWPFAALVVVFGPISVFFGGVLGRIGAALMNLTRRVDVPGDALPGSIADVRAREALERRRRGLILVTLFGSVVAITYAVNNRVDAAADRRARRVEQRLQGAAPTFAAAELIPLGEVEGVRVAVRGGEFVAEVGYAWESRCVVVDVDSGRTRVEGDRCFRASRAS